MAFALAQHKPKDNRNKQNGAGVREAFSRPGISVHHISIKCLLFGFGLQQATWSKNLETVAENKQKLQTTVSAPEALSDVKKQGSL